MLLNGINDTKKKAKIMNNTQQNINKKLFFFQFKENFFESEEIKIIEMIASDIDASFNDCVIFYLKLITKALSHDGYIKRSGNLPVTPRFLKVSLNFNTENDTIKFIDNFIQALIEEKMLVYLKSGEIYIPIVQYITMNKKESSEAVAKWRIKKSILDKEISNIEKTPDEEFNQFFEKSFSGLIFKGYCHKENEEMYKLSLKSLWDDYKDKYLNEAMNDFIERKLFNIDYSLIQDRANYMKQTVINFIKENEENYKIMRELKNKPKESNYEEQKEIAAYDWIHD